MTDTNDLAITVKAEFSKTNINSKKTSTFKDEVIKKVGNLKKKSSEESL